jgi:hypothetical protein
MPVPIKRPANYSESGRSHTNMTGYNMEDALALVRLLLRWRHGKFQPLIISQTHLLVRPATLRIYIYNSKTYINENPSTFTQEIRDLAAQMAVRLQPNGVYIVRPPRILLRHAHEEAASVAALKGQDYKGRQLFLHWISSPHEQGEYVDIPGSFTGPDLGFFEGMQKEYANIVSVEFSPENVRVIWIGKSTKESDESPW